MKSKSEKRKAKRLRCLVPVEGKKGTAFENIQTIDIGKGGIGFITKQSIPLDEEIALALELAPEQDPVFMMGQVRWVGKISHSDQYRIGMKFANAITAYSQKQLKKYLASCPKEVPPPSPPPIRKI